MDANLSYPWPRTVATVVLAAAIVASASLLGRAAVDAFRIHHAEKRVTVTGSASRRIRSDLVVWRATVKSQAPQMADAYKKLAADVPALVAFIKARGIEDKDVKVAAAVVHELHPHDKDDHEIGDVTSAYVTEQQVEVTSTDIDRVEKTSREATELIDRGVFIQSDAPLYIYTKLSELKVQILADASKDARQRAEQIAQHTGARITGLISARMGVMQVNAAFESDVSAEGNNDKTSLEKDAMAIVTASFAID
jgi:hypothetical protein